MATGIQPGAQPRLCRCEVDIGNRDLGESKLAGPALQPRPQFGSRIPGLPLPCRARRSGIASIRSHPLILETRSLQWPDEAACAASAARLASLLVPPHAAPGAVDASVELHGPLGAGKTTFVRHLLRALGVAGRIKSPTFAVMEPYALPGGNEASHFDFYRFDDPREWLDAGFRDVYTRPGLKIAEWPERAGDLLPCPDLRLRIDPLDDDRRVVRAEALSPRGAGWLAGWTA